MSLSTFLGFPCILLLSFVASYLANDFESFFFLPLYTHAHTHTHTHTQKHISLIEFLFRNSDFFIISSPILRLHSATPFSRHTNSTVPPACLPNNLAFHLLTPPSTCSCIYFSYSFLLALPSLSLSLSLSLALFCPSHFCHLLLLYTVTFWYRFMPLLFSVPLHPGILPLPPVASCLSPRGFVFPSQAESGWLIVGGKLCVVFVFFLSYYSAKLLHYV